MNRRIVLTACGLASLLTACPSGGKKLTSSLNLTPPHLTETLQQLCTTLSKAPRAETVAQQFGPFTDDPDNKGSVLLIKSPPAGYERIQVTVPRTKNDIPRVAFTFTPGKGPSATEIARQLGGWKEGPMNPTDHLPDRRMIRRNVGSTWCTIHAGVEPPEDASDPGKGDRIRELSVIITRL